MKTYHMWSPGDEKPGDLYEPPNGLEVWDRIEDCWKSCDREPRWWNVDDYRWPAEPVEQPKQRPTAFGLLSEEEQAEIREAAFKGLVEAWEMDLRWIDKTPGTTLFDDDIYRIKEQTPQERYSFKVTVNGEEIDPKSMSKSSWMNLRGGE